MNHKVRVQVIEVAEKLIRMLSFDIPRVEPRLQGNASD